MWHTHDMLPVVPYMQICSALFAATTTCTVATQPTQQRTPRREKLGQNLVMVLGDVGRGDALVTHLVAPFIRRNEFCFVLKFD
jgi:hypothetical protein